MCGLSHAGKEQFFLTEILSEEQRNRRSGWRTVRRVSPYLWPADNLEMRARVVLALVALVMARVVSVTTPFYYKGAVDALAPQGEPVSAAWMLGLSAIGLTVAYGVMRLLSCLLYTSDAADD